MSKVLFASDRPLERAENLKRVWDCYDGPKEFVQYMTEACRRLSPEYSVFVCDEIPKFSPGKTDATTTVFVTHGIVGDKLYGLDCSKSHRAGAAQVDYAICTTEYGRLRTMSQLDMPAERVLTTGMPMTDNYFGKRKGDGGTLLAEYPRAYLYAPTWRARGNPPLPEIDWELVDSLLYEDEIVAVKRHMCTKNWITRDYAHVAEVSNMAPSAPWLIDCDVLATDFSSILFDGYALGKPSVLVTDGAADYQRAHGMYEDYPGWYGGRAMEVHGHEAEFVDMLREAAENGMGDVERACLETTVGGFDGEAGVRVAELITRFA